MNPAPRTTRSFRTWVPAAALLLLACGPSEEIRQQLNQLALVSAEKDSLLAQVVENNRLMTEIGAEIAKVERAEDLTVSPETPAGTSESSPGQLMTRIQGITARVADSEQRLQQSQRRIRALGRQSDSLRTSLEQFEATIKDFEAVIDNQKQMIASLTERVQTLEAETVRLAAEKAELEDEANRAYYVIGTKEDLIKRGIVVEEGGSRVLFIFGKRGKTLRPATKLNTEDFVEIDMREVTEIPLPAVEAEYQITSRQNVLFLEQQPDEKGHITGDLRITDPAEFWRPSRFLIVVQG